MSENTAIYAPPRFCRWRPLALGRARGEAKGGGEGRGGGVYAELGTVYIRQGRERGKDGAKQAAESVHSQRPRKMDMAIWFRLRFLAEVCGLVEGDGNEISLARPRAPISRVGGPPRHI